MRVISGELKGRKLAAVPGTSTRPTTDKVKESMFNIIGPYFDSGTVLDLFSGTGGLGIEALSRGMSKGVFVDKDFKALQVVKKNIETCRLQARTEVYRNDARKAIIQLSERGETFDLVFLDPPYHLNLIPALLTELEQHGLLTESARVVAEHGSETELPEAVSRLTRWKLSAYGDTSVSFYWKGTLK
jgi:16S rRNA (guanine(966)-N(2))-methyltransferase RsmD